MKFTREAILQMAKESGLLKDHEDENKLVHFAALVGKSIFEQQAMERQVYSGMMECRPLAKKHS